MRIAMIGTRGVPARYGGFETAVDEIGRRLVERGHEVVVYCRGEDRSPEYSGMRRVVLPALRSRTAETLSHTGLSVLHQVRDRADVLVADAVGIQDYYRRRYGAPARFLPYGAPLLEAPALHRLPELGLAAGGYHLVVARFEPENHVDVVLRGYLSGSSELPLVVVGSAPYAGEHVLELQRLGASDPRVRMLGAVFDQELLDALYAGAASYLHGHSVGGTNPSLLRALGAGAPVTAVDVDFNREVAGDNALFFSDDADVAAALKIVEGDLGAARQRGADGRRDAGLRYRWDDVAAGYEDMCRRLLAGEAQP